MFEDRRSSRMNTYEEVWPSGRDNLPRKFTRKILRREENVPHSRSLFAVIIIYRRSSLSLAIIARRKESWRIKIVWGTKRERNERINDKDDAHRRSSPYEFSKKIFYVSRESTDLTACLRKLILFSN